jgi:septum formation topological specificity factor MinE
MTKTNLLEIIDSLIESECDKDFVEVMIGNAADILKYARIGVLVAIERNKPGSLHSLGKEVLEIVGDCEDD